jgi:hypothetical protein
MGKGGACRWRNLRDSDFLEDLDVYGRIGIMK